MTQLDPRGASTWLRHRLTLIVYAEDLNAACELLRCTCCDLGLRLHHPQEEALGMPPAKWAISGECDAPLHTAARLVQGLAVHLAAVPVVLIRLDMLGNGPLDATNPWRALSTDKRQTPDSVTAHASERQTLPIGVTA